MPSQPSGPFPSGSPSSSAGLSRRAALAAASAALGASVLGACAKRDAAPAATTSPLPASLRSDADVGLAARALAAEQQQVALLTAVSGRFPALAGRLRGARAAHERHVAVLTRAAPSPTASPAPRAPGAVRVPGSPPAALRAVVDAEHRLLGRHREAAVAAASGRLARVLAGMAAAAAQQAAALGARP